MRPTQFHDHDRLAKKESASDGNAGGLKVSKGSHLIKKSSPSSSSSTASASSFGVTGGAAKPLLQQQRRHPVIVYTHSPKVIQTHPKDFLPLVQKLTGFLRNEDDHHNHRHHAPHQPKKRNGAASSAEEDNKNYDNESSSVITDKNYEGQVNSYFRSPLFDSSIKAAPFLTNIPDFTQNSVDFLRVNHQPYCIYTDSLFFTPNMKSPISSSPRLERLNEFGDLL